MFWKIKGLTVSLSASVTAPLRSESPIIPASSSSRRLRWPSGRVRLCAFCRPLLCRATSFLFWPRSDLRRQLHSQRPPRAAPLAAFITSLCVHQTSVFSCLNLPDKNFSFTLCEICFSASLSPFVEIIFMQSEWMNIDRGHFTDCGAAVGVTWSSKSNVSSVLWLINGNRCRTHVCTVINLNVCVFHPYATFWRESYSQFHK